MLLIGYFEGIDSEHGIAWRTAESPSLRRFLGYGLSESMPGYLLPPRVPGQFASARRVDQENDLLQQVATSWPILAMLIRKRPRGRTSPHWLNLSVHTVRSG